MTVNSAITELDSLKPNLYTSANKIQWLSRLDMRIYQEILLTHELNEGETLEPFTGYSVSDGSSELLVGEPYAEMYVHWLCAQVDLYNREIESFNSSNAMFESVFDAYRDAYNRSHIPKSAEKRYF